MGMQAQFWGAWRTSSKKLRHNVLRPAVGRAARQNPWRIRTWLIANPFRSAPRCIGVADSWHGRLTWRSPGGALAGARGAPLPADHSEWRGSETSRARCARPRPRLPIVIRASAAASLGPWEPRRHALHGASRVVVKKK